MFGCRNCVEKSLHLKKGKHVLQACCSDVMLFYDGVVTSCSRAITSYGCATLSFGRIPLGFDGAKEGNRDMAYSMILAGLTVSLIMIIIYEL